MSASKILALTSLFLATTFAQTDWKEFNFRDGNFRVMFPDNPQQQTGTELNLHEFSATAGAESYALAYASVVDEKRTSVEGYPGKWVRFVGQNTSGELAIYFVGRRLYVLHALAPKSAKRPQGFSEFLSSFRLLSQPRP